MGLFTSLFSRRETSPPVDNDADNGVDNDEDLDHQDMAMELMDAFADHDAAGLAGLTPAQRDEQVNAREALYDYVDHLWDDAKARDLDPAIRPEWSVVAGMRDLTSDLLDRALAAQRKDESGPR